MSVLSIEGRSLVAGRGQGSLLHADLGLSFWGGVDPFSGEVIDRHHPLSGQSLAGRKGLIQHRMQFDNRNEKKVSSGKASS